MFNINLNEVLKILFIMYVYLYLALKNNNIQYFTEKKNYFLFAISPNF